MSPVRVLHCPHAVGGNSIGLARAERELGVESWTVAFEPHHFGYQPDEILWHDRDKVLMREFKRWYLLGRAVKHFDIIHFNFGCSIIDHLPRSMWGASLIKKLKWKQYELYARIFELCDVRLLRKLHKGIVVTFQGDDARQGDFCNANFEISPAREVEAGYYSKMSDETKRDRIAVFTRFADRIYALNPDLLHVLPDKAQFLPYSHVDPREWQPVVRSHDVPTIVHAPTHRGVKGTRFVLDAISRLQREGVPLKFSIVEGVTHTEARRMYEQADLVIDQLLVGWYGGMAVEAMALGKPVISYIREGDLRFIPPAMSSQLPIIRATPSTLYDVLSEWLTVRRQELSRVGSRSRAYVERWHDPLWIANRLKREYETIVAERG